MQTPDGRECPYYYVDYHRRTMGREVCHLLEGHPDAQRWTSALCATCAVPDIKRANGCPSMHLHARIGKPWWRFWGKESIQLYADCERSHKVVENPYVGCGECHPPVQFVVGNDSET